MSKSKKNLQIEDKGKNAYNQHTKIIENKLYGRKVNQYDISKNGIPLMI